MITFGIILSKRFFIQKRQLEEENKRYIQELAKASRLINEYEQSIYANKEWFTNIFYYTKEVYEQLLFINILKGTCVNLAKETMDYEEWLLSYSRKMVHPLDKEKFLQKLSFVTLIQLNRHPKQKEILRCRLLVKGKFQWFCVESHFKNLNFGELLLSFKNINEIVKQEQRNTYNMICLNSQLFKVYDNILEIDLNEEKLYQIEMQKNYWIRKPILKSLQLYLTEHIFPSDYMKCVDVLENDSMKEMKLRLRKNTQDTYQWHTLSFKRTALFGSECIIIYMKNIQSAWVCEDIRRRQLQRALERRA
jgi:hypothetical protein